MCICVIHIHVHVCMERLEVNISCLSHLLSTLLWGRVSHGSRSPLIQLDETPKSIREKPLLFLFQFWDFKRMLPCLSFYGGAMNLNTGVHGWQASSLLTKTPPKPPVLNFSWKPIFCGIKLSQYCISFFMTCGTVITIYSLRYLMIHYPFL